MSGEPSGVAHMPTKEPPDEEMIARQESMELVREYNQLLSAMQHAEKQREYWEAEHRRLGMLLHTHRMKSAAWVDKNSPATK